MPYRESQIVENVLPFAERAVRHKLPRLWRDMKQCAPLRDLFAKALWFSAKASIAHLPLERQRYIFSYVLLTTAIVTAQRLDDTIQICDTPKGTCCVCLDDFTIDGPAVFEVKACRHQMHAWCLGTWIGENPSESASCPACRNPIRL